MRSARRPPGRLIVLLTGLFVLASAGYVVGQRGGRSLESLSLAPEAFPDGDFVLCRLVYPEVRRFGNGWRTDFPLGERNLSIRFSELTRTRVSRAVDGAPNHYLVRLTDDQLFSCPFLMAGDVGSMGLDEQDAARLREYLLKGGFLWTDDMWGDEQWQVWTREIAKVLPPDQYPIEDVTTADPIFNALFSIREMPQISHLGFWRRSGGSTSEQGADSETPYFHAIRDGHGRIMVAMTRNTDIADAFEREGDDPEFFQLFGAPGYSLGINVLLYALTH